MIIFLGRDLSNGTINRHIWKIKEIANFSPIPWIAHGPKVKNAKLWSQINVGLNLLL